MEEKLVLQMDSIVKTFPGVKALDGCALFAPIEIAATYT